MLTQVTNFLILYHDCIPKIYAKQSYAVNLQLTSVASKLGVIPHVLIDELLLSSSTNLTIGARSYYTVLSKVFKF